MKAIGFRVEPKQVHYVVVEREGDHGAIRAVGKLPAPASYSEAQALDWYRNKIRTLIDEHEPDKVAVRYPEPIARQRVSAHPRFRIEGVVLEAAHSRGKEITTGAWATWSARLGTRSAKEYLNKDNVRGTDTTSITDDYKMEAFLAALAVITE